MPWPTSQDYNEAVQNPASSFRDPDLKFGRAQTNALGLPLPRSGNFADVYAFHSPGGGHWAVKLFTRGPADVGARYAAVQRHLRRTQVPFAVDFTFLEGEILVRGRRYPVLKMQWMDGLALNEFAARNADNPHLLEGLFGVWARLGIRLRKERIAHGDLQHGNLIFIPSAANSLAAKLIDYDGTYVPELAARPSGELGHACYQHPLRVRQQAYGPEVDRFPLLLVATGLACLRAGGRPLWRKYDCGDNFLFREADLQTPVKSRLFAELLKLTDPLAHRLVCVCIDALRGRLEAVPLLEEVLPELPPVAPARRDSVLRGTGAGVRSVGPTPAAAAPAPTPEAVSPEVPGEMDGWAGVVPDVRPRRRQRGASWAVVLVGMAVALASSTALGLFLLLPLLPGRSPPPDTKPNTHIVSPNTPKIAPRARTNPAKEVVAPLDAAAEDADQ